MRDYNLQHPVTSWRLSQNPPLSGVELARLAGISSASLSKIERGHRDRLDSDACLRITEATGIDLGVLQRWHWTAAGRKAAKRVLRDAARSFRARAAKRRARA